MKRSFIHCSLAFIALFSACSMFIDDPVSVTLDLSDFNPHAPKTTLASPTAPILSTIHISVTGPGMSPIEADFTGSTTEATLMVPAGKERTFRLTADAEPGLSPITRKHGSVTADLVAGNNTLALRTGFESKLLIPDTKNSRIAQIDDINDTTIDASATITSPYDIEQDSFGRIYVACYAPSGNNIYMTPDITKSFTSLTTAVSPPSTSIAIAIDRTSDTLYHIVQNASIYQLYSLRLTATDSLTDTLVSMPVSHSILLTGSSTGLAVDADGMLYVLANVDAAFSILKLKITGSSSTYVAHRELSALLPSLIAYDIMAKGDRIYLSAYHPTGYPSGEGAIVEFSHDLLATTLFGGSSGLYQPLRFLAITNKKFYICDDNANDGSGNEQDKVLAFDDISDTTLESTAFPASTFNFYLNC